MPLYAISDLESLEAANKVIVRIFYDDLSPETSQMIELCKSIHELKKYENVAFVKVLAAENRAMLKQLQIVESPTLMISIGKRFVVKIIGANVPAFMQVLDDSVVEAAEENSKALEMLNQRIEALISQDAVMVFMKGDRVQPRCGFSKRLIEILTQEEIVYATFDILTDPSVRAGLKIYSDWPTYPQIYVEGKFVGGLDIIEDALNDGEFGTLMEVSESPSTRMHRKLETLVNRQRVMLFMKGDRDVPRCGFSSTIIGLLGGAEYGTFDILSDETVRAELKKFSDWPTYPQLYVEGKFMGGLDIIQSMEGKELKDLLKL